MPAALTNHGGSTSQSCFCSLEEIIHSSHSLVGHLQASVDINSSRDHHLPIGFYGFDPSRNNQVVSDLPDEITPRHSHKGKPGTTKALNNSARDCQGSSLPAEHPILSCSQTWACWSKITPLCSNVQDYLAYTYAVLRPEVVAVCPAPLWVTWMAPAALGWHWVGVAGEYGLMVISAVGGEKLPRTSHHTGSSRHFLTAHPGCMLIASAQIH